MSYDRFEGSLLGCLIGANMNVTTDQAIVLKPSCIITDIIVTNGSISLTTAAGGFYLAVSKTTAIVGAAQAYSGVTGTTVAIKVSTSVVFARITSGTPATPASIYFSLTTAQGAAATADIYVTGIDITNR